MDHDVFLERRSCISLEEQKERYDNSCKEILKYRIILACILKSVVPEFCGFDVEEIAKRYIIPGVIHADSREELSEKIQGYDTEDSTRDSGWIRYDVKFGARLPGSDRESMDLLINVEAQSNYRPGYPIVKRGIFYGARMLSAEPGSLFCGMNYYELRKVYSIWICTGKRIPRDHQYSISRYYIEKADLAGKVKENREDYDMMTVIVLRLRQDGREGDVPILNLLQALFHPSLENASKKEKLQGFGVEISQELGKEIDEMCNLSDGVYEEGIEKGIEKGALIKAQEVALRLLKEGTSCEKTANLLNVPVAMVVEWQQGQCVNA